MAKIISPMFKKLFNFFGVKEHRKFIDALSEYFERYQKENPLSEVTKVKYQVYHKNITLFLQSTGQYDLLLQDVRVRTTEELRYWLHKNLPTCTINHSSRHIEVMKRVLKYAVIMEYIQSDPISPVKTGRDRKKEIVYLTTEELKKLINWKFETEMFSMVTDLFLFQCYTGLSYADLYSYELVEKKGKMWLVGKRQKTQKDNEVFLFPEAFRIYLKYSGSLPQITNQSYNRILKEVARIVGIRKKITTHVGRKTHANLLAERGMGTKPIAIQLGNTEAVCNVDYIHNSPLVLEKEIERMGLDKLISA